MNMFSIQNVRLLNYEALENFIRNVPRSYFAYIHDLLLCTICEFQCRRHCDVAHSVASLLSAATQLSTLDLQLEGSLDKSVLPAFSSLTNLRKLSITNCGNENTTPL